MCFRSCSSVLTVPFFVVPVTALMLAFSHLASSQETVVLSSEQHQRQSLLQTVAALEANGDTWHPLIAESMTSLAQLMQQEENHEEALAMLERALHISRVNNGLFSLQQAPVIDMQVNSHMALGEWAEADSLRQYHFYIHSRSMQSREPELIPAIVSYAEWHIKAYEDRRIEVMPVTRLIDAYQLYSVALNLAESQNEPAAWPRERFLQRMAYVAWRLSLVAPQMRPEVMYARSRQVDDSWVKNMTNDENQLRPSTFAMGEEALQGIIALRAAHLEAAAPESSVRRDLLKQHVEAVLQLADWHLLFLRRQGSAQQYQLAWQMLANEDEDLRREVFGKVVSIPAYDEYLQPELLQVASSTTPLLTNSLVASPIMPVMTTQQEWPWVDMRFDLTRFGRVSRVELLNSSTDISESVRRQVITGLRNTPMRPLVTETGLESSDGWVYRFPYDPGRLSDTFSDENDVSDEEVFTDEFEAEATAIESAAIEAQ